MTTRSIGMAGLVLAVGSATSSAGLVWSFGGTVTGGFYGYPGNMLGYDGEMELILGWEYGYPFVAHFRSGPIVENGELYGYQNTVSGSMIVGAGTATPLHYGDTIGPSSVFAPGGSVLHTFSNLGLNHGWTAGSLEWTDTDGAFLGFAFSSPDGVRYGYLRLVVDSEAYRGFTEIYEIVHESRPGTPVTIVIPEPGLLLTGLACLWLTQSRRRRIA